MSASKLFSPVFVRRVRLDFGLTAALGLCLFTLWPLLQHPGLPNGTDTFYHIYRVAEMDRAWSHGVLLPRWAETFYYGYGSPLFQYYASLTYYVASALMRLFSLDPTGSLRVLTVLALLAAGSGMYYFARDQVGKLGGVTAALCFVYSPYIVYTEPYARGVYPELLAFALFPWIMWCYGRILKGGQRRYFAAAALGSGALIITHNLMAAVLTGFLAAWLCWNLLVTATVKIHGAGRRCVMAGLAILLGVALAACFWVPVVREADAVRLDNLTSIALLDYRNFFVPLDRLLAATPRADAGAVNGLLHQLNLGPAQWGLALSGVTGSVIIFYALPTSRQSAPWRFLVFFGAVAAILVFLMLPAAQPVWEAVTPLSMLQFPWRLLGPAAFCLSALAGLNARWITCLSPRMSAAAAAVLVIVPITTAMPMLFVPEWTNTHVDTSIAAYHRAETSGLQMATTYSNEYLPVTVQVMPGPTERLIDDYADGYPVDKAHREALPQGVRVELLEHSPQHDAWQVEAAAAFTMEVLTFYFPGWQAEIDGRPATIYPSSPHGLITFDVPAGEHSVRVYLGRTPAGDLGTAITLAAALIMAATALRQRLPDEGAPPAAPLPLALRTGVAVGGVIQAAMVLLLMRAGVMWFDSPPGQAQPAQNPTFYNLGGQVQILGYDLNGTVFNPGDRIDLALYWYTPEGVDYGYASFVHVSAGGPPLAQQDKINPAGRPTLTWTSDGYYYDPYAIILPDTMPPGEYQLLVGLYTCDLRPAEQCGSGDRAPVADQNGRAIGDAVPLAAITVR